MKILKNALKCCECGDVIVSVRTDEMVRCSCGRCGIMGGNEYVEIKLVDYPGYELITECEFADGEEKRSFKRSRRKQARYQRRKRKEWLKKNHNGRHRFISIYKEFHS